MYCYYTGDIYEQNGFQFGVEIDTGSGTTFTRQRYSDRTPGGWYVQVLAAAGDFRVGALSCEVTEGTQTKQAISFQMKKEENRTLLDFQGGAPLGKGMFLPQLGDAPPEMVWSSGIGDVPPTPPPARGIGR
uniref:Uncharacterized protein n=1 Tax=Branchiostoma floridae TaxID=7739 RepID=C3ZFU0_BRAFL|eukprot:XP_002592567.1 hypothetical protein BRAFLDRAFT_68889 [Branchiostoma floridae]